jgi:hypothetical protein
MSAKVELNYDKLDALLQFKISVKFCAEYLGVSVDTIQRRLKEEKGMTFEQYHASKLERTAVKLQQKAIEMALAGDRTMLIFSLKNLAGWADKLDHGLTNEAKEGLTLAYSIGDKPNKV